MSDAAQFARQSVSIRASDESRFERREAMTGECGGPVALVTEVHGPTAPRKALPARFVCGTPAQEQVALIFDASIAIYDVSTGPCLELCRQKTSQEIRDAAVCPGSASDEPAQLALLFTPGVSVLTWDSASMRFHTLQFVTMDVPDSIASPRFGLNAHIWAHPEGLALGVSAWHDTVAMLPRSSLLQQEPSQDLPASSRRVRSSPLPPYLPPLLFHRPLVPSLSAAPIDPAPGWGARQPPSGHPSGDLSRDHNRVLLHDVSSAFVAPSTTAGSPQPSGQLSGPHATHTQRSPADHLRAHPVRDADMVAENASAEGVGQAEAGAPSTLRAATTAGVDGAGAGATPRSLPRSGWDVRVPRNAQEPAQTPLPAPAASGAPGPGFTVLGGTFLSMRSVGACMALHALSWPVVLAVVACDAPKDRARGANRVALIAGATGQEQGRDAAPGLALLASLCLPHGGRAGLVSVVSEAGPVLPGALVAAGTHGAVLLRAVSLSGPGEPAAASGSNPEVALLALAVVEWSQVGGVPSDPWASLPTSLIQLDDSYHHFDVSSSSGHRAPAGVAPPGPQPHVHNERSRVARTPTPTPTPGCPASTWLLGHADGRETLLRALVTPDERGSDRHGVVGVGQGCGGHEGAWLACEAVVALEGSGLGGAIVSAQRIGASSGTGTGHGWRVVVVREGRPAELLELRRASVDGTGSVARLDRVSVIPHGHATLGCVSDMRLTLAQDGQGRSACAAVAALPGQSQVARIHSGSRASVLAVGSEPVPGLECMWTVPLAPERAPESDSSRATFERPSVPACPKANDLGGGEGESAGACTLAVLRVGSGCRAMLARGLASAIAPRLDLVDCTDDVCGDLCPPGEVQVVAACDVGVPGGSGSGSGTAVCAVAASGEARLCRLRLEGGRAEGRVWVGLVGRSNNLGSTALAACAGPLMVTVAAGSSGRVQREAGARVERVWGDVGTSAGSLGSPSEGGLDVSPGRARRLLQVHCWVPSGPPMGASATSTSLTNDAGMGGGDGSVRGDAPCAGDTRVPDAAAVGLTTTLVCEVELPDEATCLDAAFLCAAGARSAELGMGLQVPEGREGKADGGCEVDTVVVVVGTRAPSMELLVLRRGLRGRSSVAPGDWHVALCQNLPVATWRPLCLGASGLMAGPAGEGATRAEACVGQQGAPFAQRGRGWNAEVAASAGSDGAGSNGVVKRGAGEGLRSSEEACLPSDVPNAVVVCLQRASPHVSDGDWGASDHLGLAPGSSLDEGRMGAAVVAYVTVAKRGGATISFSVELAMTGGHDSQGGSGGVGEAEGGQYRMQLRDVGPPAMHWAGREPPALFRTLDATGGVGDDVSSSHCRLAALVVSDRTSALVAAHGGRNRGCLIDALLMHAPRLLPVAAHVPFPSAAGDEVFLAALWPDARLALVSVPRGRRPAVEAVPVDRGAPFLLAAHPASGLTAALCQDQGERAERRAMRGVAGGAGAMGGRAGLAETAGGMMSDSDAEDGPAHLPLDPEAFHPWERIAGSAPGRSGRSTDRRRDAPAYHLVLCDPAAPRPLASVRFPPFERPTCVALWQPDAMPASSGTRTPVATGVRTGRAEAYEDFLDVGDDGYGGYRRLFTDTGLWRCVHDGAGRGDFTARGLRRSADEDSDDGMGEGDDERYSGVGTGSGSGGGVDDDGREVMDSGGSGDGSESAMSGDDSDMGPWGRPGVLGRTVGGDASGAGAGADGGWGASGAGAGAGAEGEGVATRDGDAVRSPSLHSCFEEDLLHDAGAAVEVLSGDASGGARGEGVSGRADREQVERGAPGVWRGGVFDPFQRQHPAAIDISPSAPVGAAHARAPGATHVAHADQSWQGRTVGLKRRRGVASASHRVRDRRFKALVIVGTEYFPREAGVHSWGGAERDPEGSAGRVLVFGLRWRRGEVELEQGPGARCEGAAGAARGGAGIDWRVEWGEWEEGGVRGVQGRALLGRGSLMGIESHAVGVAQVSPPDQQRMGMVGSVSVAPTAAHDRPPRHQQMGAIWGQPRGHIQSHEIAAGHSPLSGSPGEAQGAGRWGMSMRAVAQVPDAGAAAAGLTPAGASGPIMEPHVCAWGRTATEGRVEGSTIPAHGTTTSGATGGFLHPSSPPPAVRPVRVELELLDAGLLPGKILALAARDGTASTAATLMVSCRRALVQLGWANGRLTQPLATSAVQAPVAAVGLEPADGEWGAGPSAALPVGRSGVSGADGTPGVALAAACGADGSVQLLRVPVPVAEPLPEPSWQRVSSWSTPHRAMASGCRIVGCGVSRWGGGASEVGGDSAGGYGRPGISNVRSAGQNGSVGRAGGTGPVGSLGHVARGGSSVSNRGGDGTSLVALHALAEVAAADGAPPGVRLEAWVGTAGGPSMGGDGASLMNGTGLLVANGAMGGMGPAAWGALSAGTVAAARGLSGPVRDILAAAAAQSSASVATPALRSVPGSEHAAPKVAWEGRMAHSMRLWLPGSVPAGLASGAVSAFPWEGCRPGQPRLLPHPGLAFATAEGAVVACTPISTREFVILKVMEAAAVWHPAGILLGPHATLSRNDRACNDGGQHHTPPPLPWAPSVAAAGKAPLVEYKTLLDTLRPDISRLFEAARAMRTLKWHSGGRREAAGLTMSPLASPLPLLPEETSRRPSVDWAGAVVLGTGSLGAVDGATVRWALASPADDLVEMAQVATWLLEHHLGGWAGGPAELVAAVSGLLSSAG